MSSTTIYALATPPGKSGVAVLRLSGQHALQALFALSGLQQVIPRHAHYAAFSTPEGEIIDRGIALYFPAPHSFTGEDVVECQLHGSIAVMRQMLATLSAMEGLRPAEAGEFARRAFMNGKMDLLETEGLADLINAETSQQKQQALRQMQGQASAGYESLRVGIIECLGLLEAYIDFPDEDIPESVLNALQADLLRLRGNILGMLDDEGRGERLRDGLNVVILGAPNAGKSSLLNLIARRDVAIVSTTAGTTRDLIEIHLDIAGYPVVFIDTAGLRASDDEIEAEGIRRAMQRAESAYLKLVVFDSSVPPDAASLAQLGEGAIAVANKADLGKLPIDGNMPISTLTGEGVDALLKTIETRIIAYYSGHESAFITRERHRALLHQSIKSIDNSNTKPELELRCEELRQASLAIGKITGKIAVDDVLDVIFSRFCIGK